eukprot:scaffold1134_cov295-Prasinococcus_capsulatus_cf.AAC.11
MSTLRVTEWEGSASLTYRIPDPARPPPSFGVCFAHFFVGKDALFRQDVERWTTTNVLALKEAGGARAALFAGGGRGLIQRAV